MFSPMVKTKMRDSAREEKASEEDGEEGRCVSTCVCVRVYMLIEGGWGCARPMGFELCCHRSDGCTDLATEPDPIDRGVVVWCALLGSPESLWGQSWARLGGLGRFHA